MRHLTAHRSRHGRSSAGPGWLVLVLVLTGAPAVAEEVRIELAQEAGAPPTRPVEVYALEPVATVGISVAPVARLPSLAAGGFAVDLPFTKRLGLALFAEGFWSPPCEPTDGICRMEIEPGGLDRLRFLFPSGGSPGLPGLLVARAWRHGTGEPDAEVPTLCRREGEEPVWACAIPLGGVDLRLDLPGFAPVYRWDVQAENGPSPEPADIQLARGAHVEAWVEASSGSARLLPAGRWRQISEERLGFATREVEVAGDGRIHFPHVPPGRYEMAVETPNAGGAELEVTVEADDRRVVIRDVPLLRSQRVEIQLDPPTDGLGEPWRVALSHAGDGSRAGVERLSLDLTGYGVVEGVVPGRYHVSVRDSQGSVWHLAPHLLGDAPLLLSIPHVPVEGRIRRGDEGLATTLVFGTTQGVEQVVFRSDERGRFSGYLPRGGLWEVELGDEGAGCERFGGELGVTLLPPVAVEVGPSGKAILGVALPDTLVEGRVVRGQPGEAVPVAGAQVVAVRPQGPPDRMGRAAQVWTDDEGRFALRGLEPGPLTVVALTEAAEAESSLELREGVEHPELELHLESKVALPVRLVGEGAPVPGARVYALPVQGGSAHATTGLDGRAELEVPVGSSGTLMADPPGLGLLVEPFTVGEDPSPIRRLECRAAAGDLLLEGFAAPPLHGSLVRRGAAIDLHLLRSFAHERVGTTEAGVVYRRLAAGEYTVCLGEAPECRSVTVPPGGTAALSRPGKEDSAP